MYRGSFCTSHFCFRHSKFNFTVGNAVVRSTTIEELLRTNFRQADHRTKSGTLNERMFMPQQRSISRRKCLRVLHPPVPSPQHQPDSSGLRLLNLIKILDKSSSNEDVDMAAFEEILELMQELIAAIQRRGLLRGNGDLAKKLLETLTNPTASSHRNAPSAGNYKKKKSSIRIGAAPVNDLSLQLPNSTLDVASAATPPSFDVQLLMSAIGRVLEHSVRLNGGIWVLLVAAATNIITAACHFVQSKAVTDVCFLAEYEIVAVNGKSFLSLIEKLIQSLLQSLDNDDSDDEMTFHAVACCLRAASALINLFGTKLSRSSSILMSLRANAWKTMMLSCNSDFCLKVATNLLATIPFAGGTDNLTPSILWNQTLTDAVAALLTLIGRVAPFIEKIKDTKDVGTISDYVKLNVIDLCLLQETLSESTKSDNFCQLVKGLAGLIIDLFSRDTIGVRTNATTSLCSQLLATKVNVELILCLVDIMISFSTAAENKFYATKKRLRQETVNDGALSPISLVGSASGVMRTYGHELLNVIITSLSAACLLPYARRIYKICYHGVLSSSSSTLRRVIDPTSMVMLDGKRERWMHTSLSFRMSSIQSFQFALQTFGIDVQNHSRSNSNRSDHDKIVERGISIVCGTVIEELSSDFSASSMEWGSIDDRAHLVASSATCLAACLNSGGSFLSISIRCLIDKVITTSLSSVLHLQPISSYDVVKVSFLRAGIAAMCNPWQDGASSSFLGELLSAAKSCLQDPNSTVAETAIFALRLGDVVRCPQAPPLHVVTRASGFFDGEHSSHGVNAHTIADKIAEARSEIELAKATIQSDMNQVDMKASKRSRVGQASSEAVESIELSTSKKLIVDAAAPQVEVAASHENEESKIIKEQRHEVATMATKTTAVPWTTGIPNQDDESFPMIVDCGPDEEDV
jgi:hypothetical protein